MLNAWSTLAIVLLSLVIALQQRRRSGTRINWTGPNALAAGCLAVTAAAAGAMLAMLKAGHETAAILALIIAFGAGLTTLIIVFRRGWPERR